jgi:hypothetical protein
MLIGVACLLVFLLMALLMYSRRLSALLALPLMAIVIAVIAQIPGPEIVSKVLNEGALKLNATYTTTMFGAMLAELMNKQGIAKSLVRWVAEFAGDNPFLLAVTLTLTTALLFSTLGGLGAVIMVGTIVLPVMLSLGIANIIAGSLFLFGISLGGLFNIAGWQLYSDVLKIQPGTIIAFVVPLGLITAFSILCLLAFELRSWKNWKYLVAFTSILGAAGFSIFKNHTQEAASAAAPVCDSNSVVVFGFLLLILVAIAIFRQKTDAQGNPGVALVTPLVPLFLVLCFHWAFIPAFMAGLAFGTLITWKRNSINVLTRSIIDGIAAVIPAVCLMMGIGMLINAVSHKAVTASIQPILTEVIPTHALPYVIVFSLIAPLALYRGPLSLWGMGSGLVSLVQKATALTSPAIMAMLLSVGTLQGVCDPTNTQNIWVATYLGTDTQIILKKTIPYAWTVAVGGLLLAVAFGYVPI